MQQSGDVTDILIVEDDIDIREALTQILEEEGYRVVGAAHGGEAVAWLAKNPPPCLILLDLMMPVMNGWEFREHQRHDPRLAHVPVVIISADGGALKDVASFQAAGFLLKPVELDDLLATVERLCHGSTKALAASAWA